MADSWSGSPATWTTGEAVTAAKMNTEIRDRMDALLAGLKGDTSADADIKQAVKSGTLASRPAAGQTGRMYFATDVLASYLDDGTRWQHVSGRGAFDSFDRATSTTLGNAESGHPWVEESGDLQINASAEVENVSGTGIATVDTGGVLHTATYLAEFKTGATIGSFDAGLILKYIDTTHFLWVHLFGSNTFNIRMENAGNTYLGSNPIPSLTADTHYLLRVLLRGSIVFAELFERSASTTSNAPEMSLYWADDEDVMGSYIVNATKVGVRLLNTTNSKCSSFSVVLNG